MVYSYLQQLGRYPKVLVPQVSLLNELHADGKRTGNYILAGEEFTFNDKGESAISYADYAIGFVDEIENTKHIQERISLLGK